MESIDQWSDLACPYYRYFSNIVQGSYRKRVRPIFGGLVEYPKFVGLRVPETVVRTHRKRVQFCLGANFTDRIHPAAYICILPRSKFFR